MSKPLATVMLTCVNSQVAPSMIRLLKDHPDYDVRVIGCDAAAIQDILGRHFCDACYTVPFGDSGGYIGTIESIVRKEGVQLIFPGSDEECLQLARSREILRGLGCNVACSPSDVVLGASDKYNMMSALLSAGIPTGKVFVPDSLSDIDSYAQQLGYPDSDFVFKPRFGRGSRGFRIVTSRIDSYQTFIGKDFFKISLEELKDIFGCHKDKIPDHLMMEFYPGDKYSADILIADSRVISMVIRNNGPAAKVNPPTQIAEIVFDRDVRSYAEAVVGTMPFDYFVQVEMGRTEDGRLGLIEVNTRLDATLPITTGLGVNFFREMITYGISGKVRSNVPDFLDYPKRLRFRRFWDHIYEELPD